MYLVSGKAWAWLQLASRLRSLTGPAAARGAGALGMDPSGRTAGRSKIVDTYVNGRARPAGSLALSI